MTGTEGTVQFEVLRVLQKGLTHGIDHVLIKKQITLINTTDHISIYRSVTVSVYVRVYA